MQTVSKRSFSSRALTGLCATVMTLGLTTGSVLAVEISEEDYKLLQKYKQIEAGKQQPPTQSPAADKGNDDHYDHSGAPHETPHKAEPRPVVTQASPRQLPTRLPIWFSSSCRINTTGIITIPAVTPTSF